MIPGILKWVLAALLLALIGVLLWLASPPEARIYSIPPQGPGETIRLRDGRTLGYRVTGDPGGAPVLLLHGTPGSRLIWVASDSDLKAWHVRLIQPDRPGFGLSTPAPSMEYSGYHTDVEQLLDHLQIEKTAVLGWSAGTPWSLALAATLGTRVSRAAVVGALMPPDDERLRTRTPLTALLFIWSARHWPNASHRLLDRLAAEWEKDPESFFRGQNLKNPKVDLDIIFRPEVAGSLKKSNAETFRYGIRPLIDGELRRMGKPWDIAWREIRVPVRFWHGLADAATPPLGSRILAERIPNATIIEPSGEGHFLIISRAREIFSWLSE
jgi:pimeloyl-ACP methyl ester carboxylesterase